MTATNAKPFMSVAETGRASSGHTSSSFHLLFDTP